ncbi:MAG TPA: isochorismatase family protein [Steroidobacteraceae bacterium]|nr:isochorismatase family protein [Steroidobacteraceae bacterium]
MKASHIGRGDALLVIDVQRDFLPGGTFSVPAGDEVIKPINRIVSLFERAALPIFYSRDWHPPNHVSFKVRGGPWPRHCVASTDGAAFALTLRVPAGASIISKATTADRDALSAFQDTTLASQLRAAGVHRVYVGGLSTDYSVRATVLDAKREGFDVKVLTDAVRAVDVQPGDGQRALQEMQLSGAQLTSRC